jgi:hypothetical protein
MHEASAFSARFSWSGVRACGRTSPAFTIHDAPKETESLRFMMNDKDAPNFRHGGSTVPYNGSGRVPAFTAVGSELLFEVFSQRYERGSTLVTSNLPFDEWTSIFGSERLTGALLDRLTHHVHILEMNGQSYRLATSKKAQPRSAQGQSQNPKTQSEGDPATEI